LPGFYLFRTMSLSLLLHLSNIALLLIRHLTPSTSWATLGNKFSRMYLTVSVLSVWNRTLCVYYVTCTHPILYSCLRCSVFGLSSSPCIPYANWLFLLIQRHKLYRRGENYVSILHRLKKTVLMAIHCLFQSSELLFQSWTWTMHLSRRMTSRKQLKRFLSSICFLFNCSVEFALEHAFWFV